DGAGLLRTIRNHVHVVDLDSGETRRLTYGDWHAGDPGWSPDGTRLAFSAAPDADADLTYRVPAYVIDAVARNAEPERVGGDDWQVGPVTWTPDGTALLAVGRTDTQVGIAGLLRIPLDGGSPVDLAASLDRNVMPGGPGYPGGLPQVGPGGDAVLFCVRDRGSTHLYEVPLGGGEPRLLLGGDTNVSGLSVGAETIAVVRAKPTSYGEVATVDRSNGETTTRSAHGSDELSLRTHEQREFTISDGTIVHGWLLRDPDRSGPLPLLVDIHGGPHNAWNGAADPVHLYHQVLADRGWAVLLVNPRSSDGYGDAFFTAATGAWGQADANDFLEPIDRLVEEGIVDPDRLAVSGYSYGGFMTCYLTSRDSRFAAAVAGGVVSDLTSMAGTSDAAHYLGVHEVGGTPWGIPEHFAALSPLTRVGDVRTPTLVVHGADDERCPVGQAEQWFTALREQHVPSQLVLYPGASHLFILEGTPSHRADFNRRVIDWVERHAAPRGRRGRPQLVGDHWQHRLSELASAHKVPGASLGILRLGGDFDDVVYASHGVLSKATGVQVTDDSVFQIGSITKAWTATVVMQFVEEGKLDLDTPVSEVLPELNLGDPDVAKQVTMRHLLTHTSGIDGDVFTDTGRGDDCLERYVEQLAEVRQNHPLGVTLSYCNSGFILAGRVIEKLTGKTWDEAMRERLFTPLGLSHTVTLPEEALMFRAAVGHVAEEDEDPEPAPMWGLPRSAGPAGLITATAADVLEFARLHLSGGVAADGTRVLGEDTTAAMVEHQADVPDPYTLGDSWGLGWIRFGWDGRRLIGHDGNTIGQSAFLRILPEQGIAVTLLTNGGNARDLYEDLYREIFADLAGVDTPEPIEPSTAPPSVDASRFAGTYERSGAYIEVFEADGKLRMRDTATGPIAEMMSEPTHEFDLLPVADSQFAFRQPGTQTWVPVIFYNLATGEPYVHFGMRATPKVS
ncbi:MAG: serine hydrolase, partial [Actinomycetia bacterium]|nr:serine hydrolase [Actinomycetes bacterium]